MVLRLVSGSMLEKSNKTGPLADRQKVVQTDRLRVSLFFGFLGNSGKFPKSSRFSVFGKFPKIFAGNFFELDHLDVFLIFSISDLIFGSFYFTGNFRLSKFENRDCTTGNFPYGPPIVRIALREPKNGYATMNVKLR